MGAHKLLSVRTPSALLSSCPAPSPHPPPRLPPQPISPRGATSRATGEAVGPGSLTEPCCPYLPPPPLLKLCRSPRTYFLACLKGKSRRQKSKASVWPSSTRSGPWGPPLVQGPASPLGSGAPGSLCLAPSVPWATWGCGGCMGVWDRGEPGRYLGVA